MLDRGAIELAMIPLFSGQLVAFVDPTAGRAGSPGPSVTGIR
jgi:hypothetical protein